MNVRVCMLSCVYMHTHTDMAAMETVPEWGCMLIKPIPLARKSVCKLLVNGLSAKPLTAMQYLSKSTLRTRLTPSTDRRSSSSAGITFQAFQNGQSGVIVSQATYSSRARNYLLKTVCNKAIHLDLCFSLWHCTPYCKSWIHRSLLGNLDKPTIVA